MIDDYAQVMELVERMRAALPIPARPTRQVADLLRSKGVSFGADARLEIKEVFYHGDEGGITCDVTPAGSQEVVLCSVAHLRIHPKHPLAADIRAYQETRSRRLAGQGRGPDIMRFDP
jgi:hypothetical protein